MKYVKFVLFSMVALAFTGCAIRSNHMTAVGSSIIKPEPNKALIQFFRASEHGLAVQATIYDGKQYIGTVSDMTRVGYQAEPGNHIFMVMGQNVDFMEATLDAGKTYYVQIMPRTGIWKARFSFRPIKDPKHEKKLFWLGLLTLVKPNEKGYAWAKANADSIIKKHDKYLPKWWGKTDRQILYSSYGDDGYVLMK